MQPLVGIIMGSTSDWPTMKAAADALAALGVAYEARVVSAHRTPDLMAEYAKSAAGRGLLVIVAGAGGAAHLPGMVAAHTGSLPLSPSCLSSHNRKTYLHISLASVSPCGTFPYA